MSLPRGWKRAVLRGIGAPVTQNNLTLLRAWQQAEGGGTMNDANFNPLNTTQPAPGAGSINSVGVRSYTSAQQGIQATIKTLLNGHYAPIIEALKSDAHPTVTAQAIGQTPWGTGQGVLRVLGSSGFRAEPLPNAPVGGRPPVGNLPSQGGTPLARSPLAGPPVFSFKPPPVPDLSSSLLRGLGKISQGWDPGAILQSTGGSMLQSLLQPSRLSVSRPPASTLPAPAGARPARPEGTVVVRGGGFGVVPVSGKIIGTPYQGTHTLGNWESDNAVDVATPVGTPIRAIKSGVIGPQFGSLGEGGRFAGLRLHLQSRDNEYYYAHLSRFASGIRPGAQVKAGQIIGYSGEANGVAHLHLGEKSGNPLRLYR